MSLIASLGSSSLSGLMQGITTFAVVLNIISGVVSVYTAVCEVIIMWRFFQQHGVAGWKSLIPFYNMFLLCKLVWGSGAKMFYFLIPIAGIVFAIKLNIDWALAMGHSVGFGVGMSFLFPIFGSILLFSRKPKLQGQVVRSQSDSDEEIDLWN